ERARSPILRRQEAQEGVLEAGSSLALLVAVEAVEDVASQRERCAAWVALVERFPPHARREREGGLLRPRDRRDLERVAVEHRSAEVEDEWDVSVRDRVEVLRRGDAEIEAAGDGELRERRLGERGHHRARVRPEHALHRDRPTHARAEEVREELLFV